MPDVEDVVRALVGIRKAGDIAVLRLVYVRMGASREHLVRVALVGHIEDDLIVRGIKDCVECDGRLDDAEVRTNVPADAARAPDERVTHLISEGAALLRRVAPYVRGFVDRFKIQRESPPLTYDNTRVSL